MTITVKTNADIFTSMNQKAGDGEIVQFLDIVHFIRGAKSISGSRQSVEEHSKQRSPVLLRTSSLLPADKLR